LLALLDEGFRAAAERGGEWLRCAPGCSECCHGPFPITRLDARRLRSAWLGLQAADPNRAGEIRRRAQEAVAALRDGYPGDPARGRLTGDERALDRFFARHPSLPCPALGPLDGRCELYDARPVACRTYGPPIRFEQNDVPPCRLCFRGADAAIHDRCRHEPDPGALEQAILARMGVAAGEEWETLVAFVLAHG
jgi:Fe-S-cluster containining protein